MTLKRRLAKRLATFQRDARMVLTGLMGRTPPPLVDRPPREYPTRSSRVSERASERAARALRVVERREETADATSLLLEDLGGAPLRFTPGQFFTVLVPIDGQTHRRAYSASSDHRDSSRVRLTVKRVEGGLVSNHIGDHLRAGDTLRVLGPSGDFTVSPDDERAQHRVLIGGGSGITPLMAIAIALLEGEPESRVTLLYGNRDAGSVIFSAELDALRERHPERFTLQHVLEEAGALEARPGRLDGDALGALLDALGVEDTPSTHYNVCGPEPMMDAARARLLERGVDPERVHEERFSSPHLRADRDAPEAASEPRSMRVAGFPSDITILPGQTLLDAGLEAGAALDFSCAMGGCGACRVHLLHGDVVMEEPNCLTAAERDAGHILACVARPRTDVRVERPS